MKEVVRTTKEKEKFDIGQVHEAILKLKQAGLTPKGLQKLVIDKELARKVVILLEHQEKLDRLRELERKKEAGEDTYYLFNPSCDFLRLEQLQNSNIPNKYLYSLLISFKDQIGRSYTAVYVNKSHVLLLSESKDTEAFNRVLGEILELTKGKITEKVMDRRNDICQVIKLPFRRRTLTQKGIASLVQNFYMKRFTDVCIGPIHFQDVPFKVQVNANIPLKNEPCLKVVDGNTHHFLFPKTGSNIVR